MSLPAKFFNEKRMVLRLSLTVFSGRSQLSTVGLLPMGRLNVPCCVSPAWSVM